MAFNQLNSPQPENPAVSESNAQPSNGYGDTDNHHRSFIQHQHRQRTSMPNLLLSSSSLSPLLPSRSQHLYLRSTSVKLDSDAGATGTSIAELPGRHITIAPWLAILVWLVIAVLVAVNVAGFLLGYQARKEYRIRVREQASQAKLDLENQGRNNLLLTRKEMKSFTRRSIMVLNTPANHPQSRKLWPQASNSTDPRKKQAVVSPGVPRDLFNRPPRDSILIAQVDPHPGPLIGDEDFDQFSARIQQDGFWDRASRASKTFSLFVKPSFSTSQNRFSTNRVPRLDMLAEEDTMVESSSCQLEELKLSTSRRSKFGRSDFSFEMSPASNDRSDFTMNYFTPINYPKPSHSPPPSIPLPTPPMAKRKSSSLKNQIKCGRRTSESTLVGTSPESHGDHSTYKAKFAIADSPGQTQAMFDSLEGLSSSHCSQDNEEDLTQEALSPGSPEMSPDEALVHYARSRSESVSPIPPPVKSRSSSALGFIRKSSQKSVTLGELHERFATPSSETLTVEAVQPAANSPLEISEPFTSSGPIRTRAPSVDMHQIAPAIHSIIFEEDESMLDVEEPFLSLLPINVGDKQTGLQSNSTTDSRKPDFALPTRSSSIRQPSLPARRRSSISGGVNAPQSFTGNNNLDAAGAIGRRSSATSKRSSVASRNPSISNGYSSDVSRRPSLISKVSPAASRRPSIVSRRPSVIGRSISNGRPSIVNRKPFDSQLNLPAHRAEDSASAPSTTRGTPTHSIRSGFQSNFDFGSHGLDNDGSGKTPTLDDYFSRDFEMFNGTKMSSFGEGSNSSPRSFTNRPNRTSNRSNISSKEGFTAGTPRRRHPPVPRILTQKANGNLRRMGSNTFSRTPLSGTMSSGGVRDSSFIV